MEENELIEVMKQLEAENNELRGELANKAMIATKSTNNTEYFTNINGVYAKDIDGRAETAELRTLIDGIDVEGYSTAERKIGKWIDGSDLYQRTFEVTGLTQGQWNETALGTSGIDIKAFDGYIRYLYNGEFNANISLNYYTAGGDWVATQNVGSDLSIKPNRIESGMSIDKTIITIKYTKISEQANTKQTDEMR